MPGRKASPLQKKQFWNLVKEGISPAEAAERLGFNRTTGWRWSRGLTDTPNRTERKLQLDLPDPRPAPELDGGVRDLLSDFSAWGEAFLAWDRMWSWKGTKASAFSGRSYLARTRGAAARRRSKRR